MTRSRFQDSSMQPFHFSAISLKYGHRCWKPEWFNTACVIYFNESCMIICLIFLICHFSSFSVLRGRVMLNLSDGHIGFMWANSSELCCMTQIFHYFCICLTLGLLHLIISLPVIWYRITVLQCYICNVDFHTLISLYMWLLCFFPFLKKYYWQCKSVSPASRSSNCKYM